MFRLYRHPVALRVALQVAERVALAGQGSVTLELLHPRLGQRPLDRVPATVEQRDLNRAPGVDIGSDGTKHPVAATRQIHYIPPAGLASSFDRGASPCTMSLPRPLKYPVGTGRPWQLQV